MNTRLDLLKDKQMQAEVENIFLTQEVIETQTMICEDIFDDWQSCIKRNSWNNEHCVGKLKPDYELCIRKRNLMISKFESSNNI